VKPPKATCCDDAAPGHGTSLTRALNVRQLRRRKALSSTTGDGHEPRRQTAWPLPPAHAQFSLKSRCDWQDRASHRSHSGSDTPLHGDRLLSDREKTCFGTPRLALLHTRRRARVVDRWSSPSSNMMASSPIMPPDKSRLERIHWGLSRNPPIIR
jgi:hypothetical protein